MPNFLKRSIALRFVMVLCAVIVVALAVLVGLQIRTFEKTMRHEFEVTNIIKTQLLGTQVQGGLKWKKADVIDSLYTDLLTNEDAELVSAYVFHKDSGKLSYVQSELHDAFDFEAFVGAHAELNGLLEMKAFNLSNNYVVYVPIVEHKPDNQDVYLGGLLIAWSSTSLEVSLADSKSAQFFVASLITLGLVFLMVFLLRSMIVAPLRRSIDVMSTLAHGEYNIDIPELARQDEIGVMARALEVFKKNGFERDEAEKAKIEATERMQQDRKIMMGEMATRFENEVVGIVDHLLNSITEIGKKSHILHELSAQTQEKSKEASMYSSGASQNVQTVAAASEELHCSIQEIIQQVSLSASLTQDASQQARETNEIVGSLQTSTLRIGEVVKLIQDIAEQTNLLALNATIEAARAGDAGKGFAVVANEVKVLASETARATGEISERIQEIQAISSQSGVAISRISETVMRANESMSSISAAVEEQGAATQEISRSVQEAAVGTENVSRNIDSVNNAALETGELVQNTSVSLEELMKKSDLLRIAVNDFINNIRAA